MEDLQWVAANESRSTKIEFCMIEIILKSTFHVPSKKHTSTSNILDGYLECKHPCTCHQGLSSSVILLPSIIFQSVIPVQYPKISFCCRVRGYNQRISVDLLSLSPVKCFQLAHWIGDDLSKWGGKESTSI